MRTDSKTALLLCVSLAACAPFALDGCSSHGGDQLDKPAEGSEAAAPVGTEAGTEAGADAAPPAAVIPTWTDAEAIPWLERECNACHGVDPKTGVKTPYYSAWPMEAKGITRQYLETDDLTPIAYQTILNRAVDAAGASPSPMPIDKPDAAKRLEMRAVLDWFVRTIPFAVIDANARYGNDASKQQKVIVNFKCATTTTLRTFLSRAALGALDRPPTPAEFQEFTVAELGAPVTTAQRTAIADKLAGAWRAEFLTTGLRKLATVIGGAPGIKPRGAITPDVVTDLKEELYQLFLAQYATYSYDDYFKSNTVMASPLTAPFYGCSVASGWKACPLAPPRGGLFTTLGFLNSKQQTFLIESNNYGRTAALFYALFGEGLIAATNGPSGDAVPALPDCLESTDTRTYISAPRGSAAVPAFGKICQTCHLSRHMATGSVLFRPFAMTGELYSAATLGAPGTPDDGIYNSAVGVEWEYTTPAKDKFQVNSAFLTGLLTAPTKACMRTGKPASPYVTVSSVADLAGHLLENRTSFARGFMKHAHRAFSNIETITLEMAFRSSQSFEAGKTKLPDLVRAYFLSDSLACEASP